MRDILKMVVVLAVITGISGLLLAAVNEGTQEQRRQQVLRFVKGPAVDEVLRGATNNPLQDARELHLAPVDVTDEEADALLVDIFPGFKDGALWAVALEASGRGYGGNVGVIVGIDVARNEVVGIGVTTHAETPGLGARVADAGFRARFRGLALDRPARVLADGGQVEAVSGATTSSRAVCEAVNKAVSLYLKNQNKILEAVGGTM